MSIFSFCNFSSIVFFSKSNLIFSSRTKKSDLNELSFFPTSFFSSTERDESCLSNSVTDPFFPKYLILIFQDFLLLHSWLNQHMQNESADQ